MSAHWRNTFKNPRFFFVDARVSFFLLAFMLHIRLWTLVLLIVTFVTFYLVERRGYAFQSALRAVRLQLSGPIRPAVADAIHQGPVDYDRAPRI
jgi:intracellular multiplication protein IcmT